jgi:hypothetical protein
MFAMGLLSSSLPAQAIQYFTSPPTPILQITLDASKLSGSCNLATVDTAYMHSGADYKNVTNQDSIWQTIVGDWGLDDGKGEMTTIGPHLFTMCFNVIDYYTNEADPDSLHGGVGYGPLPPGATVYNIGMVFRQPTCPFTTTGGKIVYNCTEPETGKDENCKNFYLIGVNTPQMSDSSIVAGDYNDRPLAPGALTAKYITECAGVSSVSDVITGISKVETFPVPFSDIVWIQFNLANVTHNTGADVEIFNQLGQKICTLNGSLKAGLNTFAWKGDDANGAKVPSGIYIYRIMNNGSAYTGKVIKQ